MSVNPHDLLANQDLVRVIRRALEVAPSCRTVAQLRKDLTGPFRLDERALAALLPELVKAGQAHEWPPGPGSRKPRYWKCDWQEYARQQIVEILAAGPRTRTQLAKALRRALAITESSCTRRLPSLIRPLLDRGRIVRVPNVGTARNRLSASPPDPRPYLGKVLKELEAACRKLAPAGVSREQVIEAARKELAAAGASSGRGAASDRAGGASRVAPPTPPLSPGQPDAGRLIRAKMVEIEPQAEHGAAVSLRDLRQALNMDKPTFDQAVVRLANDGEIILHQYTFPDGRAGESNWEWLVSDGKGSFYVAAVLGKRGI